MTGTGTVCRFFFLRSLPTSFLLDGQLNRFLVGVPEIYFRNLPIQQNIPNINHTQRVEEWIAQWIALSMGK